MKSEQDTVEAIANAQCNEIERYLRKEIGILDDINLKANKRQKAENERFYLQISQVRTISSELDTDRIECLKQLAAVERNLGIATDPNESFTRPLHEKMDGLMKRVDNSLLDGLTNAIGSNV